MKNKFLNKNGFMVIEILITIFILSLIGIAVISFQSDIFSLNKITGNNILVQESARRALKNITAEIRSMSPSNLGSYAIAEASTSSLTFYTNTDTDSQIEKVRYFLDGNTLKKGIIKPAGSPLTYNSNNEILLNIVNNITNNELPIFSYYDKDYDGTSDPLNVPVNIPDIRLVKVNILIDMDPLKSPEALNMTTQISIRNLKDN